MARRRTPNLPDLSALLAPPDPLTQALEHAVLRGAGRAPTSVSVAERIAVRLARAIVLDEVHAGQRLLETDIGDRLGVSRASVREALRILERDRLVQYLPRRGAFVTAPDADDLKDIYSVRGALYAALLERVMEGAPASLREVFSAAMPRLERAAGESVHAYALAVFLLNYAVFDTCTSPLLVDLLKSISLRTLRYAHLGLSSSPGAVAASLLGWRALARAIEDGDTPRVVQAALRRIGEARDSAIRVLQARH